METILEKIYYDPSKAGSFSGINRLYEAAKRVYPSIKRSEVVTWLESQYTYGLHKPVRRKFQRNKVFSSGINDQFQIDLADMQGIAYENDGYKYLFNAICVFSKYAWSVPVMNKTGKEMVRAFKIVMAERKPERVQSDDGMEFKNRLFQDFLKQNNVKFFTSKNREIKAAVVERFNRTIKGRIWKYFTRNRTYRYVDVLDQIVEGYNKSYHRSIKMAPSKVNKQNEDIVRKRLYGKNTHIRKFKFNIGDRVRVSKIKGTFEKGYLPNWSEEIFTISKRFGRIPVMYRLVDYNKEPIEGLWYEKELQKVLSEKYWIEKVIKRRKNQAFVKWFGYPDTFNSWIRLSEIERNG